ncbi:MAG TPA: flagellar export protein FliJ [Candidatus Bathyarchaeia archaeon]|nr:flagellar export protein FliJ [Candidatus Bathyarchaeia archaeon]
MLRIRQIQQDLRAQDFVSAKRQVSAAERQRDSLSQERQGLLDEAGHRARNRFDAREIRAFYQHERHVARLIDDTDAEIRRLRVVAEERRVELEEAMQRRKMVEKLRERKMDEYLAAIRKDEQKLTDEKATGAAAVARIRSRVRT